MFCKFYKDQSNQERVFNLLVQNKAKFTQVAHFNKFTPLIYASIYDNFGACELLLNNIPTLNLNKGDKFGRTPLLMAARNGNLRIVSLLLRHNVDPEEGDTSGNTPLHHAVAYGYSEVAINLI